MQAVVAKVGARGTDSVTAIDASHAAALKSAGMDFAVRYLGSVTTTEVQTIVGAGLAFMPVTYGNANDPQWADGNLTVSRCNALGLPPGVSVWLDLEGQAAYNMAPNALIAKINAWADLVKAGGFLPCLYVGAPQPLTSSELYGLHTVRYWHGQGRCVDRNNNLAEPACGWCMWQAWPHVPRGGVDVDVDFVGEDYQGRLPVWATT